MLNPHYRRKSANMLTFFFLACFSLFICPHLTYPSESESGRSGRRRLGRDGQAQVTPRNCRSAASATEGRGNALPLPGSKIGTCLVRSL